MNTINKHGRLLALTKLGMGVINYAPVSRDGRDETPAAMQKRDLLWDQFDRNELVTGEESSLSTPNEKNAADDYSAATPAAGIGGFDANQDSPLRSHIIQSAIDRAFLMSENWDPSWGPEPATTQPHGSEKTADLKSRLLDLVTKRVPVNTELASHAWDSAYAIPTKFAPWLHKKLTALSPEAGQGFEQAPHMRKVLHAAETKSPTIYTTPDADPGVIAHEFGHHQVNEALPGSMKFVSTAQGLSGIAGLGAGIGTLATDDTSTNNWQRAGRALRNAGLTTMALRVPTFINEGAANILGYRTLKQLGATGPELADQAKNIFIPSQKSYAGNLVRSAPTAGLGVGLMQVKDAPPENMPKLASNPFAGAGGLGLSNLTPPALKPPNPMKPVGVAKPKTLAGAPMNALKPPSMANPAAPTPMGNITSQMNSLGTMSAVSSPMNRAMGSPL